MNKIINVDGITTLSGALRLSNGATSSGFIEFYEDTDGGTNKYTFENAINNAQDAFEYPAGYVEVTGITRAYLNDYGKKETLERYLKYKNYTENSGEQQVSTYSMTAISVPKESEYSRKIDR